MASSDFEKEKNALLEYLINTIPNSEVWSPSDIKNKFKLVQNIYIEYPIICVWMKKSNKTHISEVSLDAAIDEWIDDSIFGSKNNREIIQNIGLSFKNKIPMSFSYKETNLSMPNDEQNVIIQVYDIYCEIIVWDILQVIRDRKIISII